MIVARYLTLILFILPSLLTGKIMDDSKIYYVKVFSEDPECGNLAGVVLDTSGLTDVMMQQIAAKVGASETVFVFPSKHADFKIRWFTPNNEVGICIHATIAALGVLDQEGLIKKDSINSIQLETKNIVLNAKKEDENWFINLNSYKNLNQNIDKVLLSEILQLPLSDILRAKIVQIFEDKELIIQVNSLSNLANLKPELESYSVLCKKLDVTGISIFTKEVFDAKNSLHTREFAPLYGYLEDPLCGMAAGAIISSLNEQKGNFRIEQGNFAGTSGTILVNQEEDGLWIGGAYAISKKGNYTSLISRSK